VDTEVPQLLVEDQFEVLLVVDGLHLGLHLVADGVVPLLVLVDGVGLGLERVQVELVLLFVLLAELELGLLEGLFLLLGVDEFLLAFGELEECVVLGLPFEVDQAVVLDALFDAGEVVLCQEFGGALQSQLVTKELVHQAEQLHVLLQIKIDKAHLVGLDGTDQLFATQFVDDEAVQGTEFHVARTFLCYQPVANVVVLQHQP